MLHPNAWGNAWGRGRGFMPMPMRGDERVAPEKPNPQILDSMSPRGARLREELMKKILPWEDITVSFDDFPYYIEERTKSLLVECVASNLKHKGLRKYSSRYNSSSQRILLQSIPGTELFRDRVVSALAREIQVPLLKLDDDHGCDHEGKNTGYCPVRHPLITYQQTYNKATTFKIGDRVRYIGNEISLKEANNRTLSAGKLGEVYEVNGDTVAVVFNIFGLKKGEAETDENNIDILWKAIVVWLNAYEVEQYANVRTHDCYIALEVLHEVMVSQQPLIVYFADSFKWPHSLENNNIFNQLPEGVVMICPENTEARSGKIDPFPKPAMEYISHMPQGDPRLQSLFGALSQPPRSYVNPELHKIFSNVFFMRPPADGVLLDEFYEQIEKDTSTMKCERNLTTIHKVLKDANLSCKNLEHLVVEDMILTREKVEKIVSWAINHYLSSCPLPVVNDEILQIPLDSIKLAISRFMEEKEEEDYTSRPKKKSKTDIQYRAGARVHDNLVSPVVRSKEIGIKFDDIVVRSKDIGVKFDDIVVHENVKNSLYETVILPIRRPELFSHGNMLRSCNRILLFGPPGTGKSLVTKALARELGADFMHITAANFSSMWFSQLFSSAGKLAPLIIYLDEVDTLPGACGRDKNDTNKLYEFMEAWDCWKSKESQRIVLIGATNRPFDLNEAVLRHMPRRIYLGLPNMENRSKLLKLFLNKENLESEFPFERLAKVTDGYSGRDLKNLCVASLYGPVEEFLKQESKGKASDGVPALRPLNLGDFLHSKSKVRPSIALDGNSNNAKLQRWMEHCGEGGPQF